MRSLLVLVCASLLACSMSFAGAITVVNPGFETGNFTGWTRSGNLAYSGVDHLAAHSGSWGAYFGPVGSLGYISQYLSTVPGEAYHVTFYLRGSGTPNRVELWWDGVLGTHYWDNVNLGGWTVYGWSGLVTNHSSTELKLGFRNDSPNYLEVDDIAVDGPVPIPEPSTLTLLGGGVLLLLLRRRK